MVCPNHHRRRKQPYNRSGKRTEKFGKILPTQSGENKSSPKGRKRIYLLKISGIRTDGVQPTKYCLYFIWSKILIITMLHLI